MVKTINCKNFSMDYISFGTGKKTLVIIPGMSVKPVTLFFGAIENQYKIFKEEFTVWLFDRKKDIKEGYSVFDMANDTVEVLLKLGLKDIYLLGLSQGGMIAQVLAARYPELIKKVVIGSSASKPNEISKKVFKMWEDLSNGLNYEEFVKSFYGKVYSNDFLEENLPSLLKLSKTYKPDELKQFAVSSHATLTFDFSGELKSVKCPALVIGAQNDCVFSSAASKEIAQTLGCSLYIYNGFTHAVYDMVADYTKRVFDFFVGEGA